MLEVKLSARHVLALPKPVSAFCLQGAGIVWPTRIGKLELNLCQVRLRCVGHASHLCVHYCAARVYIDSITCTEQPASFLKRRRRFSMLCRC